MGLVKRLASPGDHGAAASVGLLVLRLGAAGLLIGGHGWPKLASFSEKAARFGDPLGVGSELSLALAVFAEVFCALLVGLGVFTRLTSIPVVFLLAVAAFVVHADDPWPRKEFALIYLLPYLTLVFTGAGRYSVDAGLGGGR